MYYSGKRITPSPRQCCLGGRHRRLLHVVAVQVALQVEVRQRLAVANGQQLLESGIRLDVVLVLQVLLLHVLVHLLRHLRAAQQSALGLAQEHAQLISNLGGALEDAGSTGLHGTILIQHGRPPLALASILNLAVHALLQLLHLAQHGRHRLTQSVQVARNRLQVLIQSRGRHNRGRRSGLHRRRAHHHVRGGRGSGSRLLGSRLLGRSSGLRGSHHYRGRGGNSLLLRNSLLGRGSRLGGNGGVHYTGGRGRRSGHFTQLLTNTVMPGVNFSQTVYPIFPFPRNFTFSF